MNIRILGTGYSECKVKNKISKDFRKRGGVVIDDRILIDAPADVIEAADELGFSDVFKTVSVILISHSHEGHFSPEVILKLARKRKIRVLASRSVLLKIPTSENIELIEIAPYMQFTIGDYNVAVLPSNHKTDDYKEDCFNFLFTGARNFFYALDGGFINERAWRILKQVSIDVIIADAALENAEPCEDNLYHNDIYTLKRMKAIFSTHGVVTEKTKFILSHLPSDKRRAVHDELTPIAEENGMILAYDGYFTRI